MWTLIKRVTRLLDVVICQSEDMKRDVLLNMGLKEDQLLVINNPVSSKFSTKLKASNFDEGFKIITVGRLSQQKGYSRLLRIVKQLQLPFQYTIIGDGEDKEDIVKYLKDQNLEKVVNLVPYTNQVESYLKDSHLYFQGSYVEGFPNALIECLAVGTPAVVFNAPGGMNEIIINGENGYLVDNENEFVERAEQILSNLAGWPPEQVSRHVNNRFSSDIILDKYERLIESLADQ
jgi:glycosyltransferase involved in cell wall biosynthesis